MAHRIGIGREPSFQAASSSEVVLEQQLMRLDNLYGQLKVYIAHESSNGDQFTQPLREIKKVLERAALKMSQEGGGVKALKLTPIVKNFIFALATEKLPQLLMYMKRIKSGKQEMGELLLDSLCFLMLLEPDSLSTFPFVFASSLLYLDVPGSEWDGACSAVLCRLCHFVLPICLSHPELGLHPSSHTLTTTPTLMMVLQGCPKQTKHHLLTTDTLMQLKKDVCTDILSVIAYGTASVRGHALYLLLHYWPLPLPEFKHHPSHAYGDWSTPSCENEACHRGNARASVLCLSTQCVVEHKRGPVQLYMLLCPECHTSLHGSTSEENHLRLKFPQPQHDVKPNCEFQRICSGKDWQVNRAEVTCYDSSCTAIQNGQPIRMCRDCHMKQHADIQDDRHIFQVGPPLAWEDEGLGRCATMLEAVSKLLEERPRKRDLVVPPGSVSRSPGHDPACYQLELGTSREALWLLSHYCTPVCGVRASQQDWLLHLVALVLEWLRVFYSLLERAGEEEEPEAGSEAADNRPDYTKLFSNFTEVSELIDNHVFIWLRAVCSTNPDCVIEPLLPTLKGCAQVGELWSRAHDALEGHSRTLAIVHMLCTFYHKSILPEDVFMKVFTVVMPQWLDVLVDLRNEPGMMSKLQDSFKFIFAYEDHYEGMKTYGFILNKFRSHDPSICQKALFWLQDLTRLQIPNPYLPHMFLAALEQKRRKMKSAAATRSPHTADLDLGEAAALMRKESLGSFSGCDSESALVSQSSIEQDTQVVISLNSSITRSILMLDIWLAQLMELGVSTLDFPVFQKTLVEMLSHEWGSTHTKQDHRDASNMCLLCRAMVLWFNLATKLLNEYAKKRKVSAEEAEVGSPVAAYARPLRPRLSLKQIIITPMSKRRNRHGGAESERRSSRMKKASQDSVDALTAPGTPPREHSESSAAALATSKSPAASKTPPRKMAKVESHHAFQVVSQLPLSAAGSVTPPDPSPLVPSSKTKPEEAVSKLYRIFQLTFTKLHNKLHPEAIQQIVACLVCLIRNCKVLESAEERPLAVDHVKWLFRRLWKCIEGETSDMARSCVGLLFDCLQFLAEEESASPSLLNGTDKFVLWAKLEEDLTSSHWTNKFSTVDRFTVLLQFMLSPEVSSREYRELHPLIHASLAHGFCQLVQLLQDPNADVCTRTKYCIASLKGPVVEALKFLLEKQFSEQPEQRSLVLRTLSLLGSAMPETHFLSVELFANLLGSFARPQEGEGIVLKKMSEASILSGGGGYTSQRGSSPKVSVVSNVSSVASVTTPGPLTVDAESAPYVQEILSLMLRYLANPRSDAKKDSQDIPKATKQKTLKSKVSSEEEQLLERLKALVGHNFQRPPVDIRKSGMFAVFLRHICNVLDRNMEFGRTRGLMPFMLRLLTYSASPSSEDFSSHNETTQSDSQWRHTLGWIPPTLQAAWLQVLFIILYKYIHHYSADIDVQYRARWCFEIALNSLEAEPHVCPLLLRGENRFDRPILKRQQSIEVSSDGSAPPTPSRQSPTVSSPGRLGVPPAFNIQRDALSPVPEVDEPESSFEASHQLGHAYSLQPQPSAIAAAKFLSLQATKSSPPPIEPFSVKLTSDSASATTSAAPSGQLSPQHISSSRGLCSVCGSVTDVYSEETVALCTLAVGTYANRLPSAASPYLVARIIPSIAKVIIPGTYPWQTDSLEPSPGSAMVVSQRFLSSILAQFAERRLFLYLFGHDYGVKADTVFAAIDKCLDSEGEGEGEESTEDTLSTWSPVNYFLEDARSSDRFSVDVRQHSLSNLACYVEKISSVHIIMNKHLPLLDAFCKRLRSHTELLKDSKAVAGFLRVVIKLLKASPQYSLSSYHTNSIQSFTQSLCSVIEVMLRHVFCPVGGLVKLAGLWFRAFQQHSIRDVDKLVKLYIAELRRALKPGHAAESLSAPNLLSITQVLLLDENGYLGYVESFTDRKLYAPDLKRTYETHTLKVIDSLQWDFNDVLNFLCTCSSNWNLELSPQLKLLLAQLLALRVQHRLTSALQGHLDKLISFGYAKQTITQRYAQPRWQESLNSLHVLSWLLLGCMCHNTIDQTAAEMKSDSYISGPCRLLYSLNPKMETNTKRVTLLTTRALECFEETRIFWYLNLTFLSAGIWTVYMELYEEHSVPFIVDFWQEVVRCLVKMFESEGHEETYCREVLHSLNAVLIRLKKMNLSCYTLLLPVWGQAMERFPSVTDAVTPEAISVIPVESWLRDTIQELSLTEQEWLIIEQRDGL